MHHGPPIQRVERSRVVLEKEDSMDDTCYDSPPAKCDWFGGTKSTRVSEWEKSRAQRAAGHSNAWFRFRDCHPYEALHAA